MIGIFHGRIVQDLKFYTKKDSTNNSEKYGFCKVAENKSNGETEFYNVFFYHGIEENSPLAKNFIKGKLIFIVGTVKTELKKNPNSQELYINTIIHASSFGLLPNKKGIRTIVLYANLLEDVEFLIKANSQEKFASLKISKGDPKNESEFYNVYVYHGIKENSPLAKRYLKGQSVFIVGEMKNTNDNIIYASKCEI